MPSACSGSKTSLSTLTFTQAQGLDSTSRHTRPKHDVLAWLRPNSDEDIRQPKASPTLGIDCLQWTGTEGTVFLQLFVKRGNPVYEREEVVVQEGLQHVTSRETKRGN